MFIINGLCSTAACRYLLGALVTGNINHFPKLR